LSKRYIQSFRKKVIDSVLRLFDWVNQILAFINTLIHLGKKKILNDIYLGNVTDETISEEIKLVKKKIFFNLFLNIEVVRTNYTNY
jgi:hypothetical protein